MINENLNQFNRVYFGTISLFLVVFCVFPKFTGLSIAILALVSIFGWVKKHLSFQWTKRHSLFVVFYLLYVVGTIWTNHWDVASKYLEYKLSFIIFPILLSAHPKQKIDWSPIYLVWITAVSITTVLGFFNSYQCSLEGGINCYQTVVFSYIHHPTYFSAYHAFAFFLAWWGWWKQKKFFSLFWIIPFSLFSLIAQVMILSLAGMLFLIGIFAVLIAFLIFKKVGKKKGWLAISFFPIFLFLIVRFVPQINSEWNGAVYYLDSFISNPKSFIENRPAKITGGEQRLVMWAISAKTLKENPMGLGTGNMDAYLQSELRGLGQNEMANRNMNPHNQYLQIGLELGVLGMLFFLFLIGYFVFLAIKTRNYTLLLVVLSLAFNCLFESMLQRQSGIVFYTFWMLFLLAYNPTKEREEIEPSSV